MSMGAIVTHEVIGNSRHCLTSKAATGLAFDEVAPSVFIIDSDVVVCDSLESLARAAGWHAQSFTSAEAFLCHRRGNSPSCVILDVTLRD